MTDKFFETETQGPKIIYPTIMFPIGLNGKVGTSNKMRAVSQECLLCESSLKSSVELGVHVSNSMT